MVLPIESLFTPTTKDEAEQEILDVGEAVGLPLRAWDPGGIGRETIEVVAQTAANSDAFRVTLAKAGFLDYAAQTDVTPEGGPGWLDVLASSVYGEQRIPATFAATGEKLTKSTAGSLTFAAGDLHFASVGGATYTNTTGGTLAGSGGTLTVQIAADVPGSSSSAGPGQINSLVTPIAGVTCTNVLAAVGQDAEKNADLADRCRLKLASLAPKLGPQGAYEYFAKTIVGVMSGKRTEPLEGVNRVLVVQDLTTGHVTTYVANADGPYVAPNAYKETQAYGFTSVIAGAGGTARLSFFIAPEAGAGFNTGDVVDVEGVVDGGGNPIYIGEWTVTRITVDLYDLQGSTYTVNGGAGTAYRESDLDLIDKSIQANAVPNAVTATTLTAADNTIAITYAAWLPSSSGLTATQAASKVAAALAIYFSELPIGGSTAGVSDTVFVNAIIAVIFAAVPQFTNVTLSLPASDVTIAVSDVPTLGTVTPTITLV